MRAVTLWLADDTAPAKDVTASEADITACVVAVFARVRAVTAWLADTVACVVAVLE